MASPNDSCVAALVPLPPRAELERDWRALEARADASVFLSWAWIGSLLPLLAPGARLARVTRDGRLVGLAVLGCRRGWIGPALYLNEAGDSRCDRIAVEYNGVLAERGAEAAVRLALTAALTSGGGPLWRRLYLSGVDEGWAEACRLRGFDLRLVRPVQAAPFADFTGMAPGDPLLALSSNSRQQIRRSLRFFARAGEVTLARAADADEALAWLGALATLHARTWQARGKPGAFADPSFARFHRDLIGRTFADGVADILCARAGDSVIGYLYNLRWGRVAYSYQSGFHYGTKADCRPGLVAHLLAMRRYRAEGLARYCFLAGDSRYKRSLSNGADRLYWMVLCRRDAAQRIEHMIRFCRDRLAGGGAGDDPREGGDPR